MRLDRPFSKMHPALIFTILITLSLHIPSVISSFATQEAGRAAGNTVHEFRPVTRHLGQQNPDLEAWSVADSDAPFIADSDQDETVDDGFWSTEHNENTVYKNDSPDGPDTNDEQPLLSAHQREPPPFDLDGKDSPEKSAEKENPKPVFQTIKSLFKGAYNQLLEYARLIRDKIRSWLKSPRIPLFTEPVVFGTRFNPLFKKIDEFTSDQEKITAFLEDLADETVGKENNDPRSFYTSEHKEWAKEVEQKTQKDSAQHLKETLVDFYRRILDAKRSDIVQNFKISQFGLKTDVNNVMMVFRETNKKAQLKDLAKRARKYRKKVDRLRLEDPTLLLYLDLFGPANIGAPSRGFVLDSSGPIKGSNEVKKINPEWTAKTAIEMKTLEWQLPKKKVQAIFKQHWRAHDALAMLSIIQDFERQGLNFGSQLSNAYRHQKHEALGTLKDVNDELLKVFKTQNELQKDFASIHKIVNSGKWADKKDSPLEWELLALAEPIGPGRALRTFPNYDELAKTLGIQRFPMAAKRYDKLIGLIALRLRDHYAHAKHFRALRLEFEAIFNEQGQRRILKTLNKLEAPGKPNSETDKRKYSFSPDRDIIEVSSSLNGFNPVDIHHASTTPSPQHSQPNKLQTKHNVA
ncbi:hypothetical protein CROQUDRAFT_100430 [Cronartium quercuum f. sp. fusiforme G11]|uniref:Uncharacterized protein n=1 Tax=Cronartium quercuum f. sp. fusiforme G11 TaxID=708437 RepID=A0A9P6N9P8_9BASI|nr:hypothetical protein CROQUDRAFT_100430 [Cronartium quercuum f. sp. fusiforme G11]